MAITKYYYYPPVRPQFFFPKKEFKSYQHFYQPLSNKSKVFWFLFKNVTFVRNFFKINEDTIPLPISEIKEIVALENASYFFNLGTPGIEQKATVIAFNQTTKRFLKFAQNKMAMELVANEFRVLSNLENQQGLKLAKIIDYNECDEFTYMLTDVVEGQKAVFTKLNDRVLKLLTILANRYPLKGKIKKEAFSHGDFCPWNMLVTNTQELVLIDWEMAGFKPLGYDLFTFIFQTSFLLRPNKSAKTVFLENKSYIRQYFEIYDIKNYSEYLKEFAILKIREEERKQNSMLLKRYRELSSQNGL